MHVCVCACVRVGERLRDVAGKVAASGIPGLVLQSGPTSLSPLHTDTLHHVTSLGGCFPVDVDADFCVAVTRTCSAARPEASVPPQTRVC